MSDRRAGDNPHSQSEWDFLTQELEEQIVVATQALQRAEKAEAQRDLLANAIAEAAKKALAALAKVDVS